MKGSFTVLGALVSLMGLQIQLTSAGGGCTMQFKNFKDMEAKMESCTTKLNIKPGDLPPMGKTYFDDIVKAGYDDKCLMKCVLVEMKYGKEDGTMDVKFIEEDLKKNAPDGKADALFTLFKSCIDATSANAAISKDPCKSIAMTKVCFAKGQDAICT